MKRRFLQILTLLLVLTMTSSCGLLDGVIGKNGDETTGTEESPTEGMRKVTEDQNTGTTNKSDNTSEPNTDETNKPDPTPSEPDAPSPGTPLDPIIPLQTGTVKVACVGDSLTYGANATPYPEALQAMLGSKWHEVRNFGAEGRTMTLGLSDPPNMNERSYYDTKQYKDSLVYQPDIVVLCLGTNDVWRVDMASDAGKAGYVQGLTTLVSSYYEAGAQQVYVCLPPDCIKNDIGNKVEMYVIPLLEANAEALNYEIIDCFTTTKDRNEYLQNDQLHLNTQGYAVMAKAVFEALTNSDNGNSDAGDSGNGNNASTGNLIFSQVLEGEKIKDVYNFREKFQ